MPTIKFTDHTGLVPEIYYPEPSRTVIPDWFKKLMPDYIDFENQKEHSAKRCIPMLDAMTFGYTLFTSEDIDVQKDEKHNYYRWSRRDDAISFHENRQMSTYPKLPEGQNVPKWNNPWTIKTPSGYSCLFTEPINNPETPISIFSGVVDTDVYLGPVNLPFMLRDSSFVGLIPAGTPIAQIVPFARESWKIELNTIDQDEMTSAIQKLTSVFWDKYKRLFWVKKSFS